VVIKYVYIVDIGFIGLYSWGVTGARQAARFKKLYYQTLL
jgi:hypothetical protein